MSQNNFLKLEIIYLKDKELFVFYKKKSMKIFYFQYVKIFCKMKEISFIKKMHTYLFFHITVIYFLII